MLPLVIPVLRLRSWINFELRVETAAKLHLAQVAYRSMAVILLSVDIFPCEPISRLRLSMLNVALMKKNLVVIAEMKLEP
jgi:hypothetical protein